MKLNFFLLLILLPFVSFAQTDIYQPVKDTDDLSRKLTQKAQSINTIDCDFIQEKNLSILSESIKSEGHLSFKKENKLRWEYKSPFKYLVIMNNNKIFIKDENKENKFDMQSNKMFKEINNLIVSSVQGNIADSKNFSMKAFEGDKFYLIKLTPLSKNVKEFFSEIEIYFDKADKTVSKINMLEITGDNTLIKFTNKKFNQPIPDEKFAFR